MQFHDDIEPVHRVERDLLAQRLAGADPLHVRPRGDGFDRGLHGLADILDVHPVSFAGAAREGRAYFPNTALSRSVVRAAGLVRIFRSSSPTMRNRPSRDLSVT